MKQLRGPAHFNWKGGSDSYYRTLRPDIIARDSERCFFCHSIDKKLEIHHFDGNHENHDLANLRLTCRSCHNKAHNKIKNIGNYKCPRKLADINCLECALLFRPRIYKTRFCSRTCQSKFHSKFMRDLASTKARTTTGQFLPKASALTQPARELLNPNQLP